MPLTQPLFNYTTEFENCKGALVKKALTDATVAALEVAPFKVCVLEGKERN